MCVGSCAHRVHTGSRMWQAIGGGRRACASSRTQWIRWRPCIAPTCAHSRGRPPAKQAQERAAAIQLSSRQAVDCIDDQAGPACRGGTGGARERKVRRHRGVWPAGRRVQELSGRPACHIRNQGAQHRIDGEACTNLFIIHTKQGKLD